MSHRIKRSHYADIYGPTTGDRVRLGDTQLMAQVESDATVYGDECKFGGGKVLRDGMGQAAGVSDADALDCVITNALIIDWSGVRKADVGIKGGRIAGIGKAGNPAVMQGVHPAMIVGVTTEAIAGEGLIVTAGGVDTHVHFICPQLADEAIASGVTTFVGGGTGPATGTKATTCTPGVRHIELMLQATDTLPMNFGFLGKGNSSRPEGLNEQIVDLPLNGRSFHELARLTPGVALLPPAGNSQLVRPEIVNGNIMGGVSGRQTRFLLDGVDITEEHQGGTWIQTSVDALQEFSVQQNAYSAEFHGAGGTFNVVTKSGSNRLRGSAFEFLRNDAFDAKNYFAQTKEKLERNQFGGTFGGPVVIPGMIDGRGRTFFFASYEGQRRKSGAVDVAIVPSPAQRQGNFQGLAPIYDPLTTSGTARTQFAGNVIPQNRIAAAAE